jgi:hypothetical protein
MKPQLRRELTAEDVNNLAADAIKEHPFHVPSMANIVLYRLMAPERKAIGPMKRKREQMLRDHSDKWYVKLTLKIDRLTFPELTQGDDKLTEAKSLARRLLAFSEVCTQKQWDALRISLFGQKLTEKIMAAVWKMDSSFLTQFGTVFDRETNEPEIYRYLLRNREAVERCKNKFGIWKLIQSSGIEYDQSSLYRLCREIGLPVGTGKG